MYSYLHFRRCFMNNNQQQLLRILESAAMPLTSTALADKLAVSSRTIMNYIAHINSSFPDSIHSSRQGYILTEKARHNLCKQQETTFLPQTVENRRLHLLLQLLLHPQSDFTIPDFAAEIHISPESVQKDIAMLRFMLKDFSLRLRLTGGKLTLKGEEKYQRSLLSHVINKHLAHTRLSLENLQTYFPRLPVDKLQIRLQKAIEQKDYFLNGSLWPNFMRDVLIAAHRINQNCILPACPEAVILPITLDIAAALAPFCGSLALSERLWLQKLLHAYLLPQKFRTASYNEIALSLPSDTQALLQQLFNWINDNLPFIPLTKRFRVRFALNVHNLLQRKYMGSITSNPQKEDMQAASPFAFYCAQQVTFQLRERTGLNFTEDDSAYLAVHIGLALHKKLAPQDTVSCGLLIPPYFDYDQDLRQTLLAYFPQEIRIDAEATDEKDITRLEHVQLVISTMPLPNGFPVEWITTNPLLSLAKRQEIARLIARKQQENRWQTIRHFLLTYASLSEIPTNTRSAYDTWTICGHTAIRLDLLKENQKQLVIQWNDKPLSFKGHTVYAFLHLSFNSDDWALCCYILELLSQPMQYIPLRKCTQKNLHDFLAYIQRSL